MKKGTNKKTQTKETTEKQANSKSNVEHSTNEEIKKPKSNLNYIIMNYFYR